ncbi:MAG: GNAT family N-acetyltransferase [Ruminococcaceae bacterium]|nr:GNAT family N-acetyltransferase [Oscillospiraceae bacterium]
MEIILEKITEKDKNTLFRLLQYSLFEESATDLNEMGTDGLFEYKWFDKYFTDNNYDAFFIKSKYDNKLLGFVMVDTYMQKTDSGHRIAEFMVIPRYRRNKIGYSAAVKVFDMYSGKWEVSPSYNSHTSYNFWKNVIDRYTDNNNHFEEGIFIFETKGK